MEALACKVPSGQNLSPTTTFLPPGHLLLLAAKSVAEQYIYSSVYSYLISNMASGHSRSSSSAQQKSVRDRLSEEELTWGVELEFVYTFHEPELHPVLKTTDGVEDAIQRMVSTQSENTQTNRAQWNSSSDILQQPRLKILGIGHTEAGVSRKEPRKIATLFERTDGYP